MQRIIKKQIEKLKKQEHKIISKKENQFLQTKLSPIMSKVEDKIPDKLKETLHQAFYKGFKLVFDKGDKYIEKTYNKQRIQLEYDLNNYAVDKLLSNKTIKNLDKLSKRSNLKNSTISIAEGTLLGLLGIGLADIPLFISVIMKTIYEISLSYGFDYSDDHEKYYILILICAALSKNTEKVHYYNQLRQLDNAIDIEFDLDNQIKQTASLLANALLTAKFIQGLPVVGAFGGLMNYSTLNKISHVASLKYKKRFLLKKLEK